MSRRQPVFYDHDGGFDDFVALLTLCGYSHIDLLGVSVTPADRLEETRGYSFPRTLATASLRHYLAIESGPCPEDMDRPAREFRYAREAFPARGLYMGLIIHSGSFDYAEDYGRIVERNPAARLVEAWSFPTYVRDRMPTSDFTIERSILLRRTADEVLAEFTSYNDAYIWYLATTYIPLALEYDPSFGGKLDQLGVALKRRYDETSEAKVKTACEVLATRLAGVSGASRE